MTGVLIKGKFGQRALVNIKAEISVMCLSAEQMPKTSQQITKSHEERPGTDCPSTALRRNNPDLQPTEFGANKLLLCKPLSLRYFVTAVPQ